MSGYLSKFYIRSYLEFQLLVRVSGKGVHSVVRGAHVGPFLMANCHIFRGRGRLCPPRHACAYSGVTGALASVGPRPARLRVPFSFRGWLRLIIVSICDSE